MKPNNLEEFSKQLRKDLNLKTLLMSQGREGGIELTSIIVDKGARKNGTGSLALRRIVEYADRVNARITLTPAVKDEYHGTTSRRRLVKFYKRFGFVENNGRLKELTISGAMFRNGP